MISLFISYPQEGDGMLVCWYDGLGDGLVDGLGEMD